METPGNARVQFSLTGPSRTYDPARQAIRPDLADKAEAAHHFAPHYAEAARWIVNRDTQLFDAPDYGADRRATLTSGSAFALLDLTGNWGWGYTVEGHFVGYVPADTIAPAP
jgi:hypothetical protein